jgi:hypothetical protein
MSNQVPTVWQGSDADAFVLYLHDRLLKHTSNLESFCRKVQSSFAQVVGTMSSANTAGRVALGVASLAVAINVVIVILTVGTGVTLPSLPALLLADLGVLATLLIALSLGWLAVRAALNGLTADLSTSRYALVPGGEVPSGSTGINVDAAALTKMAASLDELGDQVFRSGLSGREVLESALPGYLLPTDVLDAYDPGLRPPFLSALDELHSRLNDSRELLKQTAGRYQSADS